MSSDLAEPGRPDGQPRPAAAPVAGQTAAEHGLAGGVAGAVAGGYSSVWRRLAAGLPLGAALLAVAAVWVLGCVWSFTEQTRFAASTGFRLPWLLPLVLDGMAVAMAGVAYAASLDGRPAVAARLGTALAVAASAASNGAWAWDRSAGGTATVTLAVGVPVAANVAFEVLLAELRKQVQRRRGLPAPAAVPYPRLVRLLLAPVRATGEWRRLVLELTDLSAARPHSGTDGVLEQQLAAARAGLAAAAQDAAAARQHAEQLAAALTTERGHHAGQAATADQPSPTPPATPATAGDERLAQLVDLRAAGRELTGEQVGRLFGCSERTGRRLLRQAAELHTGQNGQNGHRGHPDQPAVTGHPSLAGSLRSA